MIATATVRRIALSFPDAEEKPHFEKRSFRFKDRIFATVNEVKKTITVKLTPVDQSAFCAFDPSVIYPVPGTWGTQGWTVIELKKVRSSTLKDALRTAYATVAIPKKR
jgi:predicted DNA-binding protein (MmcQ/YjbR family)